MPEPLAHILTAEQYIRSKLPGPDQAPTKYVVEGTNDEMEELGQSLLELSAEWKRTLSPMLSYEVIQNALVLHLREAKR